MHHHVIHPSSRHVQSAPQCSAMHPSSCASDRAVRVVTRAELACGGEWLACGGWRRRERGERRRRRRRRLASGARAAWSRRHAAASVLLGARRELLCCGGAILVRDLSRDICATSMAFLRCRNDTRRHLGVALGPPLV